MRLIMVRLNLITITFLLIFLLGCSYDAHRDSVIPDLQSTKNSPLKSTSSVSRGLLGYWQFELDMAEGTLAKKNARSSLLHINTVGPINNTMGLSVSIDKDVSDSQNGYFVLDVSITHPFPNSQKLAGFDVRGILITTAGLNSGDFNLPGPNDPELLNADGYTRWWNPLEFTTPGLLGYTPGICGINPPPDKPLCSMLNPYKQFSDCLEPEDPVGIMSGIPLDHDLGRGVFTAGGTNTRRYEINFPVGLNGPKVWFNYAIDASWSAPLTNPPAIPDDFPPDANSTEAWNIQLSAIQDTLWIDQEWNAGGKINLELIAWDWQGMMDGYTGQVGLVELVSPQIDFTSTAVPIFEQLGNGSALVTASLPGIPLVPGRAEIWVGIRSPESSYIQGPQDAPNDEITAYQKISVDVEYFNCIGIPNPDCENPIELDFDDQKSGIICPDMGASAWYFINTPQSDPLGGFITLENGGYGNLDLEIYTHCNSDVFESSENPGTSDEVVQIRGARTFDLYVRVMAPDISDLTPRPFTITTSLFYDPNPCTNDENNSSETAVPISTQQIIDATVCPDGDHADWFMFEILTDLYASGIITLHNNNYADNDIRLYDITAENIIRSGTTDGVSDEIMELQNLPSGVYYIEIFTADSYPNDDRMYSLETDLDVHDDGCENDDGNNTPEVASHLDWIDEVTGTVCELSDVDWYRIDVGPDFLEGTIILDSEGLYDNDLYLYMNPYSDPAYASDELGYGVEFLETSLLSEGSWYIKVKASPVTFGDNQPYTLSVSMEIPDIGPTDFFIQALIVRDSNGSNPAIDDGRVFYNAAWADEFFATWLNGSVNVVEISYVDNSDWLSLTRGEGQELFDQYKTGSGALHVIYADVLPDMPGDTGYAWMACEYGLQSHNSTFVVMSDMAGSSVFCHELGHALGLLIDTYEIDINSCEDKITDHCSAGDWDVYCSEDDSVSGNLMFSSIGGNVNDYFISTTDINMVSPGIDSQGENFMYFHTNYPDKFHKP